MSGDRHIGRRAVTREILDTLPAEHPGAARGRRDLRILDAFLGNSGWLVGRALALPGAARGGIREIGAGDGSLVRRLASRFPLAAITAHDLAPRPRNLPPRIRWVRGDFFQSLRGDPPRRGMLVGSLVLHHFEDAELECLGGLLGASRTLLFCEPFRCRFALAAAKCAAPLFGPVTRHDMVASIRAGFAPGEIAPALRLDPGCWRWRESVARGAIVRFEAHRRT